MQEAKTTNGGVEADQVEVALVAELIRTMTPDRLETLQSMNEAFLLDALSVLLAPRPR